ncbi:BrnA antitoxin family protein [bacterium]|nr:BrnA antitoxin family protein [bacterium]
MVKKQAGTSKLVELTAEEIRNRCRTPEQEARLQRLAQMTDEGIDLSDIPEMTEEEWARRIPLSDLYRPKKVPISVKLDADVLLWLKRGGRGYQTRLNDVLRKAMVEDFKATS